MNLNEEAVHTILKMLNYHSQDKTNAIAGVEFFISDKS